jgi:hypothetical protein
MDFTTIFSQFLSLGGVISLIVNVIVTALAIMIADKIISHEISVKHSFIMAFIVYFILPLVLSFAATLVPSIAPIFIILPLVAWIILGELLLKADMKQKAIVAVIAYAVNILLSIYVSGMILSFIHF